MIEIHLCVLMAAVAQNRLPFLCLETAFQSVGVFPCNPIAGLHCTIFLTLLSLAAQCAALRAFEVA
jgi:hypothetical protein